MPRQPFRFQTLYSRLRSTMRILGVYITFQSKTMREAKAYFPTLSECENMSEFSLICPVLALTDIVQRGLLKNGFIQGLNKEKRLTNYLQWITGLGHYIAPYALRIGGRTWLLANGMDRQFVDFLGTWSSPEASARYYRAAPHLVLLSLQRFYFSVANWTYNRDGG